MSLKESWQLFVLSTLASSPELEPCREAVLAAGCDLVPAWATHQPTQPANTRIRLSVRCNAPSPLPIRPPSPGGGKKGRKSHKTCFMQNLENHRKSTHPPTHLPTHRPPMLCAIWIGKPSGRSGRQPRARQGAVAVRLWSQTFFLLSQALAFKVQRVFSTTRAWPYL